MIKLTPLVLAIQAARRLLVRRRRAAAPAPPPGLVVVLVGPQAGRPLRLVLDRSPFRTRPH